jgi:hypothetical protein
VAHWSGIALLVEDLLPIVIVDHRLPLPSYQPVILASVLDRSVMQYGIAHLPFSPLKGVVAFVQISDAGPSQSSPPEPIGSEKRHSARNSAPVGHSLRPFEVRGQSPAAYTSSPSSSAFASLRSSVPKPSVNQS